MNTFTIIFLIALVVSYAIQFWLSHRQNAYVLAHRKQVPEAFRESVPLEDHQKAADYTVEKERLGGIDGIISAVLLLLVTLGGGISLSFEFWNGFEFSPLITGVGAIASYFSGYELWLKCQPAFIKPS